MKLMDLSGMKFERLEVIRRAEKPNSKNYHWLCRCDCGNEIIVSTSNLCSGNTKSCGCLNSELSTLRSATHNLSKSRLYNIYCGMKQRCYDTNSSNYHNYGARGIRVCDEWLRDFTTFYKWSLRNKYCGNLSIDRIDNDGNYEPSNCRWATRVEQANNKSNSRIFTIDGKTQTVSQWARDYGLTADLVYSRMYKSKWSIEKALTEPICKSQQRYRKTRINP
jgi:hypothetical protein